ncbi:MAG: hypothetical protein AB1442_16805, partial [Nitrospirota bacterium]
MPKKISIITGPIVGLNSTKFIDQSIGFGQNVGEKIVSFNLFSEILEQCGAECRNAYEEAIQIGHLLNGYEYQFKCMRDKAYLALARKIDHLSKDTSVIIRTPASIEWRGYNLVLKDHRIIAETLRPDLVLTLINAEWKIKEHLGGNYGQHALRVIAQQKELSISKILEWLGSEVSVSEDWAEWARYLTGKKVKHLVFGMETPSLRNRKNYIPDV